jgi:uncharacterized membrane protein YdjX (TVP38/TMEM64 family)
MQTFAIPGTLSLSLLSGAFFGLKVGFPLVSLISTLGSTSCFVLSWCVGKPLVHAVWPDRVEKFSREVAQRRKDLLNYILFLRVTPVLPNTFINVASPIVGVPIHIFALGECCGFSVPPSMRIGCAPLTKRPVCCRDPPRMPAKQLCCGQRRSSAFRAQLIVRSC